MGGPAIYACAEALGVINEERVAGDMRLLLQGADRQDLY